MIHLECPICKRGFARNPSQMRQGPMYCSRECQKQAALVTKVCQVCGKEFTVRKTQAERSGAKYCSTACSNRARAVLGTAGGGGKVLRECRVCGTKFLAFASEAEKGGGHYCSRFCFEEHVREWASSIPGERGLRSYRDYGPTWERAKRECRERARNKCEDCGVSGVTLSVHHIRPFRLFGKDRHAEANRQSNLRLLCPQCHGKKHPRASWFPQVRPSE